MDELTQIKLVVGVILLRVEFALEGRAHVQQLDEMLSLVPSNIKRQAARGARDIYLSASRQLNRPVDWHLAIIDGLL